MVNDTLFVLFFYKNEDNPHLSMLNSTEAVIFLYIKFSEFIDKNRINEIYVKIIDQVNVRNFD